ncbi:cytochrome c-type biogenesis CcmF C-terminal domain-containing protein, partial [Chloroflexota bacterium]
ALVIFSGTVFPIISGAVRGVKISVGPPFFNQVNGPIFLAITLLIGVCALIGWRRASIKSLVRHFLWPLLAAIILVIVLFILGIREWYALVAFPMCGFVLSSILSEWFRGTRARHRMKAENYLKAFFSLFGANKPRYGGYIVHIGIILIAIGVIGSSFYDVEKQVILKTGDSMTIGNYTLTYRGIDEYQTKSKTVVTASLSIYNHGRLMGELVPEKYFHHNYKQAVTEVAIRTILLEDLYVILVGWDEDGTAAFKVMVNPLVNWIWVGGAVLVLGGLIAFWPDRCRLPTSKPTKKVMREDES